MQGDTRNLWIAGAGGLLTVGGTMLAAAFYLYRRLDIGSIFGANSATWWGIVSGVVALGIAYGLETLFQVMVTHDKAWVLVIAGPVEEFAKLLIPVALLLFGVSWAQRCSSGVLLNDATGSVSRSWALGWQPPRCTR